MGATDARILHRESPRCQIGGSSFPPENTPAPLTNSTTGTGLPPPLDRSAFNSPLRIRLVPNRRGRTVWGSNRKGPSSPDLWTADRETGSPGWTPTHLFHPMFSTRRSCFGHCRGPAPTLKSLGVTWPVRSGGSEHASKCPRSSARRGSLPSPGSVAPPAHRDTASTADRPTPRPPP